MAATYRDLLAWQKAMALVSEIYRVTRSFPREELYTLTSQLRRAAISIPSNIAEGQVRQSRKEFYYFLITARGSLAEIETQLHIARDLDYTADECLNTLSERTSEVGRILNGLISSIKAKIDNLAA